MLPIRLLRSISRFLLGALTLVSFGPARASEETLRFNRDIRPILADLCFACHGPDDGFREAGLRLDTREGALDSGVLVPGDADSSELIRRILSDDPDERMPPPSSPKSISAPQIELLRKWVEQGAEWEEHWSFLAPQRPAIPEVSQPSWSGHPVDQFLMRRWDELGLSPAADADKRTLIRRLSLDLLGVPPTPEAVATFEADDAPDAYERLVDQLLASPHYGERMALYWLDVVRYADTAGYHSDNHRDVWLYRDYVIDAFNRNKPFDQFTVEQLAGDLLPEATREQRIASGYNRLLQTTEEGGAQPKEYTAKYLADRVRNTSVIWLGVTMGCCECHDHKYDPFTARDFYRMGAFFADLDERAVGRQVQTPLPTPEQQTDVAGIDREIADWEARITAPSQELAAAQAAWEAELRNRLADGDSDWKTIRPDRFEAVHGTVLELQEDGSLLGTGPNPDRETYVVEWEAAAEPWTALRLEALTDPSHTKQSLSRANGNFVLTQFEVEVRGGDQQTRKVAIARAEADFSQANHPITLAIDGKSETGWAVDGHQQGANRTAMFVFAEPLADAVSITVRMRHESPFAKHQIGRFRLALTSSAQPTLDGLAGLPADVVEALRNAPDSLTETQRDRIFQHFRSIAPELEEVRGRIEALRQQREALVASYPSSLVSHSVEPRVVRILPRGNWLDDSGEVVDPGVPESLHPLPERDARASRLDFGRWVVAAENPLTARVFANRLWKLTFGEGLVRTLEDFGLQGEWPTHPELLDWLAVEFQESGWDVKHLHRIMVTSRAYRQSSEPREELREIDPENRWLARQSRYRLEAEVLRDSALAASGLLATPLGGPSVKPYQPAGYWANLNFPKREWEADQGESLYRRGLYTYWCRSFLHPGMLAFDAPSREECVAARPRSNTPLQALVLLNDPTFVEAAKALAIRLHREGPDELQGRIHQAFLWTVGRAAREAELEVLEALFQEHREQFAGDPGAADQLLEVGEIAVPDGVDRAELAAWTSVARVVLNLHEMVTRN